MRGADVSGSLRVGGLAVVIATIVIVGGVLLVSASIMRTDPAATTASAADDGVEVVLAAGDLADCGETTDDLVAEVVDIHGGTIVTLGDNAYPSGRQEDFRECYEPTFGRHRWRTRPSLGNHDYQTEGAAPYFSYFGPAAGNPDRGYYGYELGPHWYAIALNSNCDHVEGGCEAGSRQVRWLERVLVENVDRNILAYWHHPVFSTGDHGGSSHGQVFFERLYEAGADLVLVSHDHDYERFTRLDPAGRPDKARGIRQFVVGTGGTSLREFASPATAPTEARDASSHGLLRLELARTGYRWEFLPAEGSTFTDQGSSKVNANRSQAAQRRPRR